MSDGREEREEREKRRELEEQENGEDRVDDERPEEWKPERAMKREAVMLPRDSQVPTEGWPALSARLTGFGRIRFSLLEEGGRGRSSPPPKGGAGAR